MPRAMTRSMRAPASLWTTHGISGVVRYGGDEFVVLPVEAGRITASFGPATVPDDDSLESDKLLALADARLEAAKRAGKNQVTVVNSA